MKRYTLESTVFVAGTVVMILEIVGSRLLAPYLGVSLYVWTSIIGVILGSLSLGYWLGGKISDRGARYDILSFILLVSGLAIALLAVSNEIILKIIVNIPLHLRWQALLASLVIFAPANILLGLVTPYATRLKLASLETSGRVVGNLYALSTIGSIFGTFLAGYYLLEWFGTMKILFLLSLVLVIFAIAGFRDERTKTRMFLIFLILAIAIGQSINQRQAEAQGFIDIDSAYNRITIQEETVGYLPVPLRTMRISGELNSAMNLDNNDLALPYTRFYRLDKHFVPDIRTALMIGAGGYSYPKNFLATFATATMDVVEIDPRTTELARKYFNLKDNPRLAIYREDGRTFLNRTQSKYDVIYGDAFGSFYALPYQLTTREAIQKMYDRLNDRGAVIVNIISPLSGIKSKFLAAEYRTFREIFPQVYLFPVENKNDVEEIQNIMLVAMKSFDPPALSSEDAELAEYLAQMWLGVIDKAAPILTDNYVPVDQYVAAMAHNR